ncbi:MAG TPA: hypothetical protein ENK39_02490 [Epsilonproteobacteria bacterium]|nr:hypothetical protein [Campylobacterota bacterium]
MFQFFKNLFSSTHQDTNTNPPGRTFKRVLTGDYFGYKEDTHSDTTSATIEKQHKLDQIKALSLQPLYVRYTCETTPKNADIPSITNAHVVFQKEVLAEKWNMLHVTEISFTIYAADFKEFEEMSGYSLAIDFRDLTGYPKGTPPVNERRKNRRK